MSFSDLFLQLALMGSLAAMACLAARALPRVSDEAMEKRESVVGVFDRALASLPLEKADIAINSFLLKTLRKLKIGVLKVDNLLTTYLNKVKAGRNGKGNGHPLLGEKQEGNTPDNSVPTP